MKGVISKATRVMQITTPKVLPLATELVEVYVCRLENQIGEVTCVSSRSVSKKLNEFLRKSGIQCERVSIDNGKENRRGKKEIAGVKVKVLPIERTDYNTGVVIHVREDSVMSRKNTNKVLKYLVTNGICPRTECSFRITTTDTGCMFKHPAQTQQQQQQQQQQQNNQASQAELIEASNVEERLQT